MEGEKKPKKRGRKPKNQLSSTKDVKNQNQNPEITENLIIQLKKNVVDDYNINSYDISKTNNELVEEETRKSEKCWNCCHSFNDHIFGIPMKYLHGVFYIYGDFCSLECAARYAHEQLRDYDFSEIFSLINLYSNIIFNKKEKINIAPNRLLLKMFGGNLTIEEYRSKNLSNYDINIPPIVPIKHLVNQYETNQSTNKNMLKLYRKNPILSDKKNITKSMNLIIDSSLE